jgi:hypothetical protein
MAISEKKRTSWEEIAVGIALIGAVGWFVARAMSTHAQASMATASSSNTTNPAQNPWTSGSYIWPGMYGGSVPAGVSADSTVAGSTPASITVPALSPVTLPPVSTPFTPSNTGAFSTGGNTASSGCGCTATGYLGAGAAGGAVAATTTLTPGAAAPVFTEPSFNVPSSAAPAKPQATVGRVVRAVGNFLFASPVMPQTIAGGPAGISGAPAGISGGFHL